MNIVQACPTLSMLLLRFALAAMVFTLAATQVTAKPIDSRSYYLVFPSVDLGIVGPPMTAVHTFAGVT